jgi:hypothetical protein
MDIIILKMSSVFLLLGYLTLLSDFGDQPRVNQCFSYITQRDVFEGRSTTPFSSLQNSCPGKQQMMRVAYTSPYSMPLFMMNVTTLEVTSAHKAAFLVSSVLVQVFASDKPCSLECCISFLSNAHDIRDKISSHWRRHCRYGGCSLLNFAFGH